MSFTVSTIDPNNIDSFPGPWEHWHLNSTGTTRYLFAFNRNTGRTLSLYRSTNSGSTWTAIDEANYPGVADENGILQSQLIVGGGTGGSDLIRTCMTANGGTGIVDFCQFDVGTLTWSAISNIGGGFNQDTHKALSATETAGVLRFLRGDGTTIVVYQCENFPIATYGSDTGIRQVRILKLSGSTWTQLGTFAAGVYTGTPGASQAAKLQSDHYILWSGVMGADNNVHIFMNHAHVPVPDGGSFYADPNGMELVHVSVSSADAVSAVHSIEQDIEQMPAATNPAQPTASTENGRASIKPDSTEIAFGYGYQTNTFPAGPGAGLHVARGNLAGDPLNPTWTVDVIATGEPIWNNGFSNDVSVSYDNPTKIALEYFGSALTTVGYGEHALANLKVYWATTGASSKGKLRFAQNTGGSSWTAAAQLWPDPDSSSVTLNGFDVFSDAPTVVAPVLTCPVTNTGFVGQLFTATMQVSGGTPPYTFVLTSGPLWLSINSSTGVVSGTPPNNATFSYTVQVTDANGQTDTITCSITISCPPTFLPGRGGNRFN